MQGCLYKVKNYVVALSEKPGALIEDCYTANLVISRFPIRQSCAAPIKIDRFDLWREGTHAIWLQKNEIRIESVNALRGNRPWVLKPRMNRPRPGYSCDRRLIIAYHGPIKTKKRGPCP